MRHKKKGLSTMRYTAIFAIAFCLLARSGLCMAEGAEKDMEVPGKIYTFDGKSNYEISSSEAAGVTGGGQSLGTFTVSGKIAKTSTKGDIPAYEVAADEKITLSYTYKDTLLTAGEEEWHLTEDGKKTIDGIKLDEKINNGAIILQTSLDREKWSVNQVYTNFIQADSSLPQIVFQTNDIQLINGCYYRVIVAYRTERKVESTKVLFIDKPNYETKKHAEVYEFYASYKNPEAAASADQERKYSLGTLVNTGKDNGYSGANKIEGDDLHYGWELGNFFVSGYTEKTDDQIFLKNLGDKITLWFNLKQDIGKLNGDSNLSVIEDKDGYDQAFQTPKTDFGHGTLIIRYTDHEGVRGEPIIYENYLEALTSAGADVRVKLFEEGDYEVALDYKVKNSKGLGKTCDYRISFSFKVRNGNCMVYPFDITTRSELLDSSVTENGFYLDLARSRYLKINVIMARWTKGVNGYTEDIRYNRPAKNGDQYTDEGVYTIEVTNPSTGKSTEKKIYVGRDNVLIASMNAKNAGYTINEIADLVDQGAEIQPDGTIVLPTTETAPPETETDTEETASLEAAAEESSPESSPAGEEKENKAEVRTEISETTEDQDSEVSASARSEAGDSQIPVVPVVIVCLATACGIAAFVIKRKKGGPVIYK